MVIVDDTSSLLSAIASGVSTIFLLDGVYTPDNLVISRSVSVFNYPGARPLIMGGGYRSMTIYGSDVVLSGITFDGTRAQFEIIKVTTGNNLPRPARIGLYNLTIQNAKAHGALITHAESVIVDGCRILNTGLQQDLGYDSHGIYVSDTDRAIVRNNYIHSLRGLSVHVYSGKDGQTTVIESNDLEHIGCYYGINMIYGNTLKQLYLRYEIQAAQVQNNTFLDGRVFIHNLNRDTWLHISDNLFTGGVGIAGYNPNGKVVTAEIDHNIFTNCAPVMDLGFNANKHDNMVSP